MAADDLMQRLTGEVATALMPLEWIPADPQTLRAFLREILGYDVPGTLVSIGIDAGAVQALLDAFDQVCGELLREPADDAGLTASWAALAAELVLATSAVFAGPGNLAGQLEPGFLAASRFIETLPRRLMDWLVIERLRVSSPALLRLLELLGVAETLDVPADAATFTTAHQRRVMHYDRIGRVLSDPSGLFGDVYGWGTPDARLDVLLDRLAALVTVLGGRQEFKLPPADLRQPPSGSARAVARLPQLRVPLAGDPDAEAGLAVVIAPPLAAGGPPGIAVLPFAAAAGGAGVLMGSAGYWTLSVVASGDLTPGTGVVFRPGQPLRGRTETGGTGATASGRVTLELRRRDPAGEPTVLAAFGGAFRIAVAELAVAAGFVTGTGADEAFVELRLRGGELTLDLTGADSFVKQVIQGSVSVPLELSMGISSRRGAYFSGGAGLRVSQPVNVSLGPVTLTGITVGLVPDADKLDLLLGLTVAVRLGPVQVSVDRIGARACASTPQAGGNLGPVDLAIALRGPDGLGLAIDAGPVTGSGYLFFDAGQRRYAGALRLDCEGIALGAVGLLTTRPPGGAGGPEPPGGYSLIMLVTEHGFAPVPLGYGFTLTGVGGLAGVNRTAAIDVLRDGLRQGTLDALLFAQEDPVPRLAQLAAAMERAFPAADGRYLFGPTAIIEWGTPTVLTLELALILELPSPVRLIVVGRMHAKLPPTATQQALVRLRMDALGVIEFDKRLASLDASLYDSDLAGFPLSGDLAMRADWGERPGFVLSVGGFHPRYSPPPGFPALRRLAISLSTGNNPRLRLEAYLALTSNTVQAGARLDLHVEAAGFALAGMLSFDALLQFAPFWLDLDIAGALALMRGSSVLMSVAVRLHLTGPAPWHAAGEATFRVFFFKVSVSFEATFGAAAPVEAPPPVAIWPLLRAALQDPGNWGTELVGGGSAPATVRALPGGQDILASPLGRLSVRQRVVPLQRDVSRFGNAPPADYHQFAIETVTVGSLATTPAPTYELFAPAQFAEMGEDERLRAPGFDRMPAGAAVDFEDAVAGPERSIALEFETIMLGGTERAAPYLPSGDTVTRLAETGAVGLARARRAGRARYSAAGGERIRVRDPEFVVASREGLATRAGVPPGDGSYLAARQSLAAFARSSPALAGSVQIARREEVLR